MDFVKMHGAGNDFIIVNNIEEKFPMRSWETWPKKFATGDSPSEPTALW